MVFRSTMVVTLLASAAIPSLASAQVAAQAPATGASNAATAPEDTGGIADIVVTAQKRQERLQRVPIAITAMNAEQLERQNIKSASDLTNVAIPGLRAVQQAGNPVLNLTMRGVAQSDVQQGTAEPGVALYIDGVYIARAAGLTSDLVDVERLEVLRGPQGTLFGRNAEGGTVSFVSKRPTGEFGGTVGGTIGDYGHRRAFVRLNLPEFANLSVKLDGIVSRNHGYVKNAPLLPGQTLSEHHDFGAQKNWGGRASVVWRPSDKFNAFYSYDHSDMSFVSNYFYNVAPPVGAPPALFPTDPAQIKTTSIPLWVQPYKDKVNGHTLALSYDVADGVQIKSITARRTLDSDGSTSLGRSSSYIPIGGDDALSGIVAFGRIKSTTFTQELQLIGTADRVQYTLGFFYIRDDVLDARKNGASIVFTGASPFSVDPILFGGDTIAKVDTNAFATFGQVTWNPPILDDKLKITLGGRYSEERKTPVRTQVGGVALNPPERPGDIRISRFDPAVTLAYQATPNINVYARYASAFRAGGVSVRTPTFAGYGPEINKQVEIGLKTDLLDRRVRFNSAAFYSWVTAKQIGVYQSLDPTDTAVVNGDGTTKLYGIENELTVVPVDGLTLAGNVNWLAGKEAPVPCVLCVDQRSVYRPKISAGFSADYVVGEFDFGTPTLHVDWTYTSKFYAAAVTFAEQTHPASKINVWNARADLKDIKLGGTQATLAFSVNNVFDNKSISYETNIGWVVRQLPRRYAVDLKFDF